MDIKNKDNLIIGIIEMALAPADVKEELIRHVRNRSAENQACFRLGQMDMRESAALKLLAAAEGTRGKVCATMLAAVQLVEGMQIGR